MEPHLLISDDHNLLREGLKSLLVKNGFDVAGESADGRTAVKLATNTAYPVITQENPMQVNLMLQRVVASPKS